MAKIFLSIPILEKPEFKMIYTVYQAILSCRGHQVRLYVNENDSLVSRVRNVHLSIFLNEYPDYDYFVSIDSDLEIMNCHPSNNIFNKLIDADKDFIGGLYALKQFEHKPICSSIPIDKEIDRYNIPFDSGVIEMMWLSSGCWCIKRHVIEKMVEHYPELTYVGDDNVAGKTIHGLCIPSIFEINVDGQKFKKYLSEDWSFCQRWKNIGGKIYADTSIVLKHIGKMPYTLWNVEMHKTTRTEMEKLKISKDLPPVGHDLDSLKSKENSNG